MAFLKKLFCSHKYFMTERPYLMLGGATKWVDVKCSKCNKVTTIDVFDTPIFKWDENKNECFCPLCGLELRYRDKANLIYENNKSLSCKCDVCNKEFTWDKKDIKLVLRE